MAVANKKMTVNYI